MLDKTHTTHQKLIWSLKRSGVNNAMYGKSRPDLSEFNKNNPYAKQNGLKLSKQRLHTKLSRFGLSEHELFAEITKIIHMHPNYINNVGRHIGTINFNKIANHFPMYGKGCAMALKRFYYERNKLF